MWGFLTRIEYVFKADECIFMIQLSARLPTYSAPHVDGQLLVMTTLIGFFIVYLLFVFYYFKKCFRKQSSN